MSQNRDPKAIGKPMPRGTGDQSTIQFTEVGISWSFDAMWRRLRAGYAWCSLDGTRLHIGELAVEKALDVPWSSPLLNNLRCLLNIPCPRRNFRGHGIGSKLIDAVISQAQRSGIDEIWGSVTADDVKSTEHLLAFYRSRGFTILDRDDECLEHAAKKIVLVLNGGKTDVA